MVMRQRRPNRRLPGTNYVGSSIGQHGTMASNISHYEKFNKVVIKIGNSSYTIMMINILNRHFLVKFKNKIRNLTTKDIVYLIIIDCCQFDLIKIDISPRQKRKRGLTD